MTFLLDVNVLIALIDQSHISHRPAVQWFESVGQKSCATCPLTENGIVRIVGNKQYANSPGTAATVVHLMNEFTALPGHVFWPDDISLLNSSRIDASRLLTSSQVTDSYLLALAQAHRGKLATLDRQLVVDSVVNGAKSLAFIG
jgi:uncharacterized protein